MLGSFGTRSEVPAMRTGGRPSTTLLLTLVAALALAAGCSPTSGPLGTPSTPAPTGDASVAPPSGDATPGASGTQSPTPAPAESASPASAAPSATATPAPSGTIIVRAYFVLGSTSGNSGLAPVLREIPATVGVARAAMLALISGPDAAELAARPAMSSDVPAGTKLLGLAVSGGVATVDLSGEFAAGLNAARPDARIAQVVYTLTQFSTVGSVAFELDGQPVAGWPGTRAGNAVQLPAIFVDRPAWGAAAGNPIRVTGLANVFEGQFSVQVLDADGRVLADQPVAGGAMGSWGAFSATVAYGVGQAQWGTLRGYDRSPKDGSVIDATDYPAWLTPAG